MFHKSNLGQFGENLPCDINGFVPEEGDSLEDFTFPGGWFEGDEDEAEERFEEWKEEAIHQAAEAMDELSLWQHGGKLECGFRAHIEDGKWACYHQDPETLQNEDNFIEGCASLEELEKALQERLDSLYDGGDPEGSGMTWRQVYEA